MASGRTEVALGADQEQLWQIKSAIRFCCSEKWGGEGLTPFSDPVVVTFPPPKSFDCSCVILSCLLSFQFSTDATYGALGVVMAVLMVGCNSACMDFWGRRNATTCLAALHFCLSLGVLTGTGMVDPLVSVFSTKLRVFQNFISMVRFRSKV